MSWSRAGATRPGDPRESAGAHHRDVGPSLNNLALLYQAQGRYAEAEPLLRRSRAIRDKGAGVRPPRGQRLHEAPARLRRFGCHRHTSIRSNCSATAHRDHELAIVHWPNPDFFDVHPGNVSWAEPSWYASPVRRRALPRLGGIATPTPDSSALSTPRFHQPMWTGESFCGGDDPCTLGKSRCYNLGGCPGSLSRSDFPGGGPTPRGGAADRVHGKAARRLLVAD